MPSIVNYFGLGKHKLSNAAQHGAPRATRSLVLAFIRKRYDAALHRLILDILRTNATLVWLADRPNAETMMAYRVK